MDAAIDFFTTLGGLAVLTVAVIAALLFLGETLRIVARLALVGLVAGTVLYFIGWTPLVKFVDAAPAHVRRVI